MIAQQLDGLVEQLALVLGPGAFITPPQLLQNLLPGRLTHVFIHSATVTPLLAQRMLLPVFQPPPG
jgi:hypothetical protein